MNLHRRIVSVCPQIGYPNKRAVLSWGVVTAPFPCAGGSRLQATENPVDECRQIGDWKYNALPYKSSVCDVPHRCFWGHDNKIMGAGETFFQGRGFMIDVGILDANIKNVVGLRQ